jgi:hypothetical protein
MPLRLFGSEKTAAARRERQEQLEKALSDSLRTLSKIFTRTAELIEKRRLERNGYEKQEQFLERSKPPER